MLNQTSWCIAVVQILRDQSSWPDLPIITWDAFRTKGQQGGSRGIGGADKGSGREWAGEGE